MVVELTCRMTECPNVEKEADSLTNAIELMRSSTCSQSTGRGEEVARKWNVQ